MVIINFKFEGMIEWEWGFRMFFKLGLLNFELVIVNCLLNDDEKVLKYVCKVLNVDFKNIDYINLEKELIKLNELKNK